MSLESVQDALIFLDDTVGNLLANKKYKFTQIIQDNTPSTAGLQNTLNNGVRDLMNLTEKDIQKGSTKAYTYLTTDPLVDKLYLYFAVAYTCTVLVERMRMRKVNNPFYVLAATLLCVVSGDTLTSLLSAKTPLWLMSPTFLFECVAVCLAVMIFRLNYLFSFTLFRLISDFFICVGGTVTLKFWFLNGLTLGGTAAIPVRGVLFGALRNFRSTALQMEPFFWGETVRPFMALRNAFLVATAYAVGHLYFKVPQDTLFILSASLYLLATWPVYIFPSFNVWYIIEGPLAFITKPFEPSQKRPVSQASATVPAVKPAGKGGKAKKD